MRMRKHQLEARRCSGEPRHSAAADGGLLARPGARHEGVAVEAQIAGLDALSTEALRIEWRRLHRAEPPKRLSRDLLIWGIAHRIQERAYGGLTLAAQRRLRSLAAEMAGNGGSVVRPGTMLKPGTKLVREWHGRTHTVTVLEQGFDYDGQRYRSLTGIAKRITGAHWSGPAFFGLKNRPSQAPADSRTWS